MFKKHGPGCPCCCPNHDCAFYNWPADSFDDLEQISGTWTDETKSIPGGLNPPIDVRVITTSDDNAVILTDPIDVNHKLNVIFQRISGTVVWRAIVGWEDADNYAYCELTITPAFTYYIKYTARLGEVIGGTDTYLTDATTIQNGDGGCFLGYGSIGLNVTVCLNDGYVTFSYPNQILRAAVSNSAALGSRAGIGTISSTEGTYNFCDFIAYYQYLDCISCRCQSCQADKTPDSLLIEMSGVAAGAVCTDVEFFNENAYTADLIGSQSCFLDVLPTPRPCDLTYLRFRLTLSCVDEGEKRGTFLVTLTIQMNRVLDPIPPTYQIQIVTLRYTVAACCPSDCAALLAQAVTLDYVSSTGDTIYDFTGATAAVYVA